MRLKVAAVTQKAYKQPYDILDGLSPAQWLGYLSRAAYVFTDSFHCTVFSIIMERNFHVFRGIIHAVHRAKNARIESVLNLFQLKFHNENVVGRETADAGFPEGKIASLAARSASIMQMEHMALLARKEKIQL